MKAILGLGNPAAEYQSTRHNLGQQVISRLLQKHSLTLTNFPRSACQIAKMTDIILGQTTTFMNLSGSAVADLINFYKIAPQDLYIIHDDLDLPVGEYRFQFDRGSAGHNGVKSLIEALGSQNFHRIRVGIDHPRNSAFPRMDVADYVLQPFSPEELVKINQTIDKIVEELTNLIRNS